MTKVSKLHRGWAEDPEYRQAYDELAPEFALAQTLIEARTRADLTQAELARRMQTTQSTVARLGKRPDPSIHPDAGAHCPRHRHPPSHQLRTGLIRNSSDALIPRGVTDRLCDRM